MTAPTASKQRLDLELVARSLAPSRERAQALVASGLVLVDGMRATSAAQRVANSTELHVVGSDHPWASRAGLKLVAGLDAFEIDCTNRVCLDAGASTGGFTDVLLSRGAARVYAVDVGHGQLDPRLAQDSRVVVMDRTNLRTLRRLPGTPPDLVTLDASFISLRLLVPAVQRLLAPDAHADVIALYKPQFELGRDAVGRGGIVRDGERAAAGARDLLAWVASACAAQTPDAPLPAPIRGTKGNQEWLIHFIVKGVAEGGRR